MKKLFAFALLLGAITTSFGQVTAKKYLLIEHFTNSNCGICANKNPVFFNLINQAQYADDVHHVSIHPMFPYSSCVFYQANTTENSAWTNLYPVAGTPSIALNGAYQNPSTPILTEAKLQTYLNQTSPLHLKVTETGPNNARQVKVTAQALDAIPTGNYKLFVAVVEKKVNQTPGNGESVHHNVFGRRPPAAGETVEYDFNFSISNNWKADEIYVLAFVKEVNTKAVLNSGTRFDPVLSSTSDLLAKPIRIFPNPVAETAMMDLGTDQPEAVELFSLNGQRVAAEFQAQGSLVSLGTTKLPAGIYLVKVTGAQGVYSGKFVKH